jgi:hypothetical protein
VQTALRSILQSAFDMTRLEIIGVGDTQAEQAWSSILAEHPTEARTRWIRMGTESPPATRLNRGLEAATAPLTFLTDGDSCLEETCLQRHVEGIRAEAGTEAAWASWLEITEEGRQIITARTKQPFTYKTLLHTPPLGLNAIFDTARLRSLGGFDERLNEPALTSHELWLRMSHARCLEPTTGLPQPFRRDLQTAQTAPGLQGGPAGNEAVSAIPGHKPLVCSVVF